MRQGMRAGVVAAAATLGTLLGFGWVRGAALRPLNSIAHMLFGTRAFVMEGFDFAVTTAALLVHILSILVWAVIFALLAGRLRGWRLLVSAIVFAGIAWITDHYLVPAMLTPGFERLLSPAEVGTLYFVLALSLAAGTRIAAPHADTF
ncbi:MAG TPA: hypothetical protein VFS44_13035 [Gemmatimonadaceae bacterium]|nr:hypothetical protein [Gemmatimonadaceae bacterium]